MKLIDKDAVVAEIERLNQKAIELYGYSQFNTAYNNVLKSINNLEVKEVDLEKEINKYISDNFFGSETMGFFANRTKEELNDQDIALCAKHFFELGLKAQKTILDEKMTLMSDCKWCYLSDILPTKD